MRNLAERTVALLIAAGMLLVACADSPDPGDRSSGSDSGTATTVRRGIPQVIRVSVAAVEQPVDLVATAAGLLVAQKVGRVVLVDPDSGTVAEPPVLDLTDEVSTSGEQGLLGLAVHPNGDRVYVNLTNRDGDTEIREYRVDLGRDPVLADVATERLILAVEQPFQNHNAGNLVFGPGGLLYVALGDGGSANDPEGNGQNPETLLGSLFTLDVEADRPTPNVLAIGLRNPWRYAFDAANDDLWLADVGQGDWEEIDRLGFEELDGANFGWNLREGTHEFTGERPERNVEPIHEYDHSDGRCSVTGGFVVRDSSVSSLDGHYLFADFCGGAILALLAETESVTSAAPIDLGVSVSDPVGFAPGLEGEIYVLSLRGRIFRLDAAG